jgi:hypothetical protein
VTIFCGECLSVPNAQPVDDDRGLCRSSVDLKTVYEGTESLEEPQDLGSKPVQQALAALQRSLHISLHTASNGLAARLYCEMNLKIRSVRFPIEEKPAFNNGL